MQNMKCTFWDSSQFQETWSQTVKGGRRGMTSLHGLVCAYRCGTTTTKLIVICSETQ